MQRLFFGFSFVCFTYRRLEVSMSDFLQVRYFGNLHGTRMLKLLQRRSNTSKVSNNPSPYMLVSYNNISKMH